jgi:hypothetical protein
MRHPHSHCPSYQITRSKEIEADLEEMREEIAAQLKPGVNTNRGIFSYWDEKTAVFNDGKGWVGWKCLQFVQLRD